MSTLTKTYQQTKNIILFFLATNCLMATVVVRTAPSLSRIGLTDKAGTATSINIFAAKGETESFQVVISTAETSLSNTKVTASKLIGPAGASIDASNIVLYREYYTKVTASSLNPLGSNQPLPPGMYPDGLIPFVDPATGKALSGGPLSAQPFYLMKGTNQPIWIDVNVPRTALAGDYTGTVTVTSTQGAATVAVNLKVWNFTLPEQPFLKSSFGFHGAQVDNKADAQVLINNRIMPFQVRGTDSAALVPSGLNTTGLPFFSQVNKSTCTISASPSISALQASIATYAQNIDKYEYAADEIGGCVPSINDGIKAWAQNVHAAGAKMLVTVSPTPSLFDDGSGTGKSAVDIWVVMPKQSMADGSAIADAIGKGDEVWSYNTLVQDPYSPKWELDFAPINYRIQPGFLNQRYGFTGLLYWGVDQWSDDPWNNPSSLVAGQFKYPGEGLLVYPGAQVGLSSVVPSMRLKWLRDGVDDYDYIQLLKNAGQSSWVSQMISEVAADWANWTKDPNVLEEAREQMGDKLDQLNNSRRVTEPPPLTPIMHNDPVPVDAAGTYQVYFGDSPSSMKLWMTITAPSVANSATTYYWQIFPVK